MLSSSTPPLMMVPVVLVAIVFQLLLICSTSYSISGPHLADVNVLLPPRMTRPVEFRLQGSDGCFKWSWDHHDILDVLPEYNSSSHCSTSARLKSISPYGGRKETAVYATDVHTGIMIRCKVYIDIFSRIQIFHNSIKLDLDGLATLRVRAFDDEENVFSSLAGLQFTWQLIPETDKSLHHFHHLAHVPLKDSPLSDCGGLCGDLDIQTRLEDDGVFSDLFVVKGVGIGHEVVAVHLNEPQFEKKEDKIVLTVVEAMSLDPISPVFVIIGAAVHYTLKVIHGNIPQVVDLPSPFHRWSAINTSVAQVDTLLGKAMALALGVTTIVVEDTRVADHIQMSSLHVVIPDILSLYMSPLLLSGVPASGAKPIPSGLPWYVVSGKQYLIEVKVFSQGLGTQEIYLTGHEDIKWQDYQSKYWNTLAVTDSISIKHGGWKSKILIATSCGQGKLMAVLNFFGGHQQEKEVLNVTQEVIVCDQVRFNTGKEIGVSQRIVLPWVPDVYQEVELKVVGGCAKTLNDYKWFSLDMSVVSMPALGVIQARKPGKANIKVVSAFDSLNYDEVEVEVLVPSSMVMLQNFLVETVVGSCLQASVALRGSKDAYFYRCDAFRSLIRWKTGSDSFTIINTTGNSIFLNEKETSMLYNVSPSGPSCSWARICAHSPGSTMLHATLAKEYQYFDHSFSGSILLKASSRIAAYLPLIVHQASDGNQYGGYWFNLAHAKDHNMLENLDNLYLAPGTQLDVMLHGGPEQWDDGIHFIENVEILIEEHSPLDDGVLVSQQPSDFGSVYRVLCKKLGSFKLLFRRGNLVGDDHPFPAVAEVNLSIICNFPSSIVVLIDEAVNAPEVIHTATLFDFIPGRIRANPVTVANGRTIRISAVGLANLGKPFGNSSSLSVRWELNECDGLAFWEDTNSLATVRSSWEKFLVLENASGVCTVRATIIGFAGNLSQYYSSLPFDSSKSTLTDVVRIQLVSKLRIYPAFNMLFFSRDARLNLSIAGGSCFLEAAVNDTRIVEVVQPPTDLRCSQLVLASKELGTAVVTVRDVGLTPPIASSSIIQVADVEWVKVNSLEEISLMHGTFLSLNISAGTNDGNVFDSSQYVYMKVCVHVENDLFDVVDGLGFPIPVDGHLEAPFFVIRAKYLGVTTLYVSAKQQSGVEIVSDPIKIEVYEPPAIYPNDIFLVPGASFVVTVRGGPRIGAYIEYSIMDGDTVEIGKFSGRLSAISPGKASVVAAVYGNGDNLVCQAQGTVKVGVPSSAILNSQSDKIAIGRLMPIIPSLSEGNLFSFYELCRNYQWTIDREEILSFQVAEELYGEHHDPLHVTDKEFSSSNYSDEKMLSFIQVIHGKSAGRTDVAVSFTCDFISAAFSQSRVYNASSSFWVESDPPLALGRAITWILPPHYTTSNVLPLSSNLFEQGDARDQKRTIIYSLLKECGARSEELRGDAIYLDARKIRTMESGCIACIVAKDKITRRMEVAACVRVAEVAQIRITNQKFPIHSINLAVGAELSLLVDFCDSLGNPFLESHNVITLNVETNYPDVIFVNDTLNRMGRIHVKAMHSGRALLRISFDHPMQKCDYLMISVGARLYPVNPILHIGSHLNFSIEGLGNLVSGKWFSANGNVVAIDALSGKAEAIGEGKSLVIFEGSDSKFQTVVTVLGGKGIIIDAPKGTLTNVPFPVKGYSFSVKFSDAYKQYECTSKDMVTQYNCDVDPPFIGYAKPWWDTDSGSLYCLFFPFSLEHLLDSIPKSNNKKQGVSVSVKASVKGVIDISGSASALFVGGFSILGMEKDSLHLNLTGSNNSILTILGNTNVQLHCRDGSQISITPVYREDSSIGGCLKYEVKVLGAERVKDKIIITLPSTGQWAEIDISFEPGKSDAVATMSSRMWAVAVGCFTLLMVTVAVFICFLDKPERSQASASFATTSGAKPATPHRSIPADVKHQSPRTPQPFMEYVRRTIDETPYYRQEARRRFNPQNTF